AGHLEQEHGGVDAHAEKSACSEVHVAGMAAEDAPGHRKDDELQDHVAGKEGIFVADEVRHQCDGCEKDSRPDPEQNAVTVHDRLPNRPCGRTASTPSSIANEMAG